MFGEHTFLWKDTYLVRDANLGLVRKSHLLQSLWKRVFAIMVVMPFFFFLFHFLFDAVITRLLYRNSPTDLPLTVANSSPKRSVLYAIVTCALLFAAEIPRTGREALQYEGFVS